MKEKRKWISSALFGAAFGTACGLGSALQRTGELPGMLEWLPVFLCSGLIATAAAYGALALCPCIPKRPREKTLWNRPLSLLVGAGILLCFWTPVFLAYYPGVMGYDLPSQAEQCFTNVYSTHHPLLHTFFLKLFFVLGTRINNHTVALALYSAVQMALMALGLSWAIRFAYREGVRPVFCWASLACFAVCPVFSVMSVSITKDPLFSVAFCIASLSMYQAVRCQKGYIRFAIFATLAILLRRNAGAAFLVLALLGLFFAGKSRERFALCCAGVLLTSGLLSAGLSGLVITSKSDAVGEMLSIPAQQLHCVQSRTVDAQEQAELSSCFLNSYPGFYNPIFADPSKFSLNIDAFGFQVEGVDQTISVQELMQKWLLYGQRYPALYAQAFLQTNRGSWYVADLSHAEVYGVGANRQGFLSTENRDISSYYRVKHTSLFPWLEEQYERLFSYNEYQRCPFLRLTLGTGFQVWMFLLTLVVALTQRNRSLILASLWALGLWGTILLGPCTLVRYILPLYILNPLLTSLALTGNTQGKLGRSYDESSKAGNKGGLVDSAKNGAYNKKLNCAIRREWI